MCVQAGQVSAGFAFDDGWHRFWITLSGEGRYPVMHFGMTGMIQLKGQEPTWYRRRPKESVDVWPPRVSVVLNTLWKANNKVVL